jgi:hypothetical protein
VPSPTVRAQETQNRIGLGGGVCSRLADGGHSWPIVPRVCDHAGEWGLMIIAFDADHAHEIGDQAHRGFGAKYLRLDCELLGHAACIDQLDALAIVETARAANDDVARHARLAHSVDQLVGLAVQEMDAADDNVVASEHRREIIDPIGIAFLRDNAVEPRYSLWIPHDGCNLVTALSKLGKNSRSGIAGRTNQRNPHRLPPASE